MTDTVTRCDGLYTWRGHCSECGALVMRVDTRPFSVPEKPVCLECLECKANGKGKEDK